MYLTFVNLPPSARDCAVIEVEDEKREIPWLLSGYKSAIPLRAPGSIPGWGTKSTRARRKENQETTPGAMY